MSSIFLYFPRRNIINLKCKVKRNIQILVCVWTFDDWRGTTNKLRRVYTLDCEWSKECRVRTRNYLMNSWSLSLRRQSIRSSTWVNNPKDSWMIEIRNTIKILEIKYKKYSVNKGKRAFRHNQIRDWVEQVHQLNGMKMRMKKWDVMVNSKELFWQHRDLDKRDKNLHP